MENKKFILLLNFAFCFAMPLLHSSAELVQPAARPDSIKYGELGNLPSEAFYKVIDNLPYRTLARLGQTSSSFHELALKKTPLHLWTTKKAQCRPIVVQRGDQAVTSLSFSPDGDILAVGCHDDNTRLLDVKTGQERMALPDVYWCPDAVFSPVDNLLAVCFANMAKFVNLETSETQQIIHPTALCGGIEVIFSNNGQLLAFQDDYANIWLADISANKKTENMRLIKSFDSRSGYHLNIKAISFAPHNKLLAACQEWDTGHLNIYELDITSRKISNTVHIELPPEACPGPIEPSFSPDGTKIAFPREWAHAAPRVYHLLLWDLINNRKIAEINLPSALGALTFSPDGKMVAAKLHDSEDKIDKKVIVVNADTGELIKELQLPQGVCDSWNRALIFSPHGDMLAVGYGDGLIMLWQVGD